MSMWRRVVKIAQQNAAKVARLIARIARDFPAEHEPCPVGSDRALDGAIMTAPSARDPALLEQARRGSRTRAASG